MSPQNIINNIKNYDEKDVIIIETLLSSTDEYPLWNWTKFVQNGYIKRVEDELIGEKVLELLGPSNTVWITTPKELGQKIGTNFDWLFFIIKPFPFKELTIELQVLDNTSKRHGFKLENKKSTNNNRNILSKIDLELSHGWSLLELDLKKLVSTHCEARFAELCCIRIHGSCRLLRVYTTSSYVRQDELPQNYRPCGKSAFNVVRKLTQMINI